MAEPSNEFDQKEWIKLVTKYITLGLQLEREDNSDPITYKMYVSVPEHSQMQTDSGEELAGSFMVHEFKRDVYKWMGLKEDEETDVFKLMYRVRTDETWTKEKTEEFMKQFANIVEMTKYQEC